MTGRTFLLGCGALVVVRMLLGAHAPALIDAHVCLVALVLALVAGAPRPAQLIGALVVGGALLSIPTSWDPWVSLLAIPAALGPAAFFLLASSGSCRAALLAGLGIGGALNALYAVVQRTYIWPQMLKHIDELGSDAAAIARVTEARPIGFSVSPDLCGGLCLAGAFAAVALALEVTDRRTRLGLALVAAVSGGGVVIVRSFGTALALVVGLAVCAVVFAARRSLRQGALVGAAGVVVAAIAAFAAFSIRGGTALALSASERIENWRAAVTIGLEHPLLGVGFMRFPAAYLAARTSDANLTRYAHSTPLQHFAETGVLGSLFLIAAVAVAALALWRRRTSLTITDVVLVGAAAAAVVRLTIDYDGHIAQTASVAAVLWGLVLATDAPAPADALQRRVLAGLAGVTLCLVIVLAWRQSALESDADPAIESYSSVFSFDVEPRIALAARALDALDACAQADGCPKAASRAHSALDDIAARAHPASAALVLRARVLVHEGKLRAALRDADAALAIDPGNVLAHQLGIGIVRTLGENATERIDEAARWRVAPPES